MKCHYCQARLIPILSFGSMPIPNNFPDVKHAESIPKYPLDFCVCPVCGLAQIARVTTKEDVFQNYYYRTGASVPLLTHLSQFVDDCISRHIITSSSKVLDIGANDGTLLHILEQKGIPGLGIDPMVASTQQSANIIPDFFTAKSAQKIKDIHRLFDVVILTHVLANITDLHDLFSGIRTILKKNGFLVIECAAIEWMLQKGQFDLIYHEHYSYFSLSFLHQMLHDEGFSIIRTESVTVQGKSWRIIAQYKKKDSSFPSSITRKKSMDDFYTFAKKAQEKREEILCWVQKNHGFVIGVGAPAKAVTVVNWCGFTQQDIHMIIDSTKEKWGKVIPGTTIPIVSSLPDCKNEKFYYLLFSWNYSKELQHFFQKKLIPNTSVFSLSSHL
jgi:2-polyprenyl-3-methyl-5-hydroxy-6-metoxy-1,4-benzoquinol methylase